MLWFFFQNSYKLVIKLLQFSFVYVVHLQAKEEFSSTSEIVQTIQTMTANLVKVIITGYILGVVNGPFKNTGLAKFL